MEVLHTLNQCILFLMVFLFIAKLPKKFKVLVYAWVCIIYLMVSLIAFFSIDLNLMGWQVFGSRIHSFSFDAMISMAIIGLLQAKVQETEDANLNK